MQRDWLQVSSNIAILVGLIIVIYELNQNHVHARSQIINDDYINIETHLYTLVGENPAAAIGMARTNPDKLSEQDRIVVDAHLLAQYFQLEAYEYISETGIYARFFNYPYAKSWWSRERCIEKAWVTELRDAFDAAMDAADAQCEPPI